jgi:hypothetical protein
VEGVGGVGGWGNDLVIDFVGIVPNVHAVQHVTRGRDARRNISLALFCRTLANICALINKHLPAIV